MLFPRHPFRQRRQRLDGTLPILYHDATDSLHQPVQHGVTEFHVMLVSQLLLQFCEAHVGCQTHSPLAQAHGYLTRR